MINDILKASEVTDFDFRKYACPSDPMKDLFPKWVDYYKTKYAISKIINPSKILEIDSCYDGDGDDDGKSIKHQDDDINGDVDSDGDGANSLMHRNDDL